jgi:hypothetical protein
MSEKPGAGGKTMSRRDEDKKRRRQKRLSKRRDHDALPSGSRGWEAQQALANAIGAMEAAERDMRVVPPATWPGACDPSLDRPDRVKFELAMFATERSPGKAKSRELEERLGKGLLGDLPELKDHLGMEEFLWHGLPGDSWHPVEAFLEHSGERFPPAAREQLRRWKEARIGLFEVGEVADDTVELREWDPLRQFYAGPTFRAITLNIAGVNVQRSVRGKYLLTHVAPWRPEEGLYCGMGYGAALDLPQTGMAVDFLGLRELAVAATPLPWNEGPSVRNEHLRRWRQREWHSWLAGQLRFPFQALIGGLPSGEIEVREVRGLLPSTPEQARMVGIYFEAPSADEKEVLVAGGTSVRPVDIASANRLALAEYHAYRKLAGPPPGTVGMPGFTRVR